MGLKGEYDFCILVVSLLILALQVHNPFLRREMCKCQCDGGGSASRPVPTVHPRPATGRPSGISSEELDGELNSIKAAQAAQAPQAAYTPPAATYPGTPPAAAAYPPTPAYAAQPAAPTALAPIASRDQLGQLMMQVAPRGVGVVLGVGKGEMALRLLRDWQTSPGLYLCDPFIHIWKGYDDPENLSDKEHQFVYEQLRNTLADQGFDGRHVLVRDFSYSFAATYKQDSGMGQQPPPSLVWFDANHAYEAVTKDLEEWWPLIPAGGVLAGSTFLNDPGRKIGVRQAVEDFMRSRGAQVLATQDPVQAWLVVKP